MVDEEPLLVNRDAPDAVEIEEEPIVGTKDEMVDGEPVENEESTEYKELITDKDSVVEEAPDKELAKEEEPVGEEGLAEDEWPVEEEPTRDEDPIRDKELVAGEDEIMPEALTVCVMPPLGVEAVTSDVVMSLDVLVVDDTASIVERKVVEKTELLEDDAFVWTGLAIIDGLVEVEVSASDEVLGPEVPELKVTTPELLELGVPELGILAALVPDTDCNEELSVNEPAEGDELTIDDTPDVDLMIVANSETDSLEEVGLMLEGIGLLLVRSADEGAALEELLVTQATS